VLTEDYADRLDDTGRWYADRIQTGTELHAVTDFLVLASAWPASSGSSNATAAASGPKAPSARAASSAPGTSRSSSG